MFDAIRSKILFASQDTLPLLSLRYYGQAELMTVYCHGVTFIEQGSSGNHQRIKAFLMLIL
jgi:hypothetical protein